MSDRKEPIAGQSERNRRKYFQLSNDRVDLSDAERSPALHNGDAGEGCAKLFAVAIVITLLWLALLYLGIPLGVIGGGVSFYLFKTNPDDPDHYSSDRAYSRAKRERRNAVFLAVLSAAVTTASLAGNYFSEDGPLHPYLNGAAPTSLDDGGEY